MEAEKPAGKRPRTKDDAAFRAEAVRRVIQDEGFSLQRDTVGEFVSGQDRLTEVPLAQTRPAAFERLMSPAKA